VSIMCWFVPSSMVMLKGTMAGLSGCGDIVQLGLGDVNTQLSITGNCLNWN
jgi:hypothetical protein